METKQPVLSSMCSELSPRETDLLCATDSIESMKNFFGRVSIACLTITKFDKGTTKNGTGDIFKVKVSLGLVLMVCATSPEKG